MSAENFIKIFKNKKSGNFEEQSDYMDYVYWTKSNKTWFNKNRAELEDLGLSKYVGLSVTQSKAEELGVGPAFKALAEEYSGNKSDEKKPIVQVIDGVPVILFSNVAFKDGIERTLDKYFGKGTASKAKELGMVKGHIYGFMTGAVLGARDELYKFLTSTKVDEVEPIMSQEEADNALGFLDVLISHLQKLDLESAELKTLTSPVFLKYNKSATNFMIELQSQVDNSQSAKLVQKLAGQTKSGTTGIRALVNPTSTQAKALDGILKILKDDGTFTTKEILDFKSSPTLKELIVDEVVDALGGKRKHSKIYNSPKIELPNKIVIAYVDEQAKKKYQNDIKKTIADAKSNKQKILKKKAADKLRTTRGAFYSLTSLQNLINSMLSEKVAENMGDGTRRDILNLRSGRFAGSTKVERMTQSRDGIITAFYTYMKYPYATFSEGGKQSSPKSRDPKLLIAKSIREIAATKVANRLRAVVV